MLAIGGEGPVEDQVLDESLAEHVSIVSYCIDIVSDTFFQESIVSDTFSKSEKVSVSFRYNYAGDTDT